VFKPGATLVLAARRAAPTTFNTQRNSCNHWGARRWWYPPTSPIPPSALTRAAGHRRLWGVDVLINNAGLGAAVPATRETSAQVRSVVEVNPHGAYWRPRHVVA
jgi:NAD(P)-dependent dehydrogenase (short-subunit alcohol dehydrogenase family)